MTVPTRGAGPLGTASSGGGRKPGPAGPDPRQRAKDLRAADAHDVLQAALPFVLDHLTAAQVNQMQRILDAAVVDPELEKEYQDLYRKSLVSQSGNLVVRDPDKVRRAERVMEKYVPITDADRRIRLDYKILITADALKPTTDNPDEAKYLERIGKILDERGVWLRFYPKLVKDQEDPSRRFYDPRTAEVWLSLGPDGDAVPTKTGKLDREALLGTTLLGAGYYSAVYRGQVQSSIDKEARRLQNEISSGLEQHQALAKIRRDAAVGVVAITDLFGGADFPDQSIWDAPSKFVLRALQLNVGGNIGGPRAFLLTAAVLTRQAASLIYQYINDSSSGVDRAVTVLKVARTAGQVAEVGLALTGVTGLVRGGAALVGEAGAAEIDELAEQTVKKYIADNPEIAEDLPKVRWEIGPKGTVSRGGIKPGAGSGIGTGWQQW